jgi:DNA repair protein RecO (recombination protein O)
MVVSSFFPALANDVHLRRSDYFFGLARICKKNRRACPPGVALFIPCALQSPFGRNFVQASIQKTRRLPHLIQQTRAIVLKKLAYADSSLIVTAFTEQFGLQQFMIKGARRVGKKGRSLAGMFQPAALLQVEMYHQPQKPLQYTKNVQWAALHHQLQTQVVKNAVATMMMELLGKCLKEPEPNAGLFAFVADYLTVLDAADEPGVVALMPQHFMLQLAAHLGFAIENNYDPQHLSLDLSEGRFVGAAPAHPLFLDGELAAAASQLLEAGSAITLYRIKTSLAMRRQLLSAFERFYDLHIAQFGSLRSVQVLEAVLGG